MLEGVQAPNVKLSSFCSGAVHSKNFQDKVVRMEAPPDLTDVLQLENHWPDVWATLRPCRAFVCAAGNGQFDGVIHLKCAGTNQSVYVCTQARHTAGGGTMLTAEEIESGAKDFNEVTVGAICEAHNRHAAAAACEPDPVCMLLFCSNRRLDEGFDASALPDNVLVIAREHIAAYFGALAQRANVYGITRYETREARRATAAS
jgi:hypothetical protein